ncbi:xanthine dehydrogenase YagS FAD-binding subunit [Duganella sp. CF517]|uniref:FAD binding domain-containing protein n=1 Tax=Duganella sp. CF517 TaxID=1881038 RepID=UPI0008B993A2|nr:xanthine dehydrogenase family protein subunit M [Duganella sp. CF517]SEO08546.1 xanthine dehydrogenase YagS FAD-binding subunit [Duganella sp. CF517]
MNPFAYRRADDAAAVHAGTAPAPAGAPPAQFLAGGTTLVDLMKLDVMRPAQIIDINGLQRVYGGIAAGRDGLLLGALARMSQVEADAAVRRNYPVIAQALQQAASPQLRNMASLGGNVLQRTRCAYFRDPGYSACNKRNPGSGCAALDGANRKHGLFGTSERCIATYPGDFAQALVALGATVQLRGPAGARTIRFEDLHLPYGDRPHIETTLRPGELITAFHVPAAPYTRRSLYLKIRDRRSYAFALTSAAVALDLGPGGVVAEARIALGGVASRPWRAHAAEAALRGQPLTEASARHAADVAFADARPHGQNAFKIELGKRTVARALLAAAALEI